MMDGSAQADFWLLLEAKHDIGVKWRYEVWFIEEFQILF